MPCIEIYHTSTVLPQTYPAIVCPFQVLSHGQTATIEEQPNLKIGDQTLDSTLNILEQRKFLNSDAATKSMVAMDKELGEQRETLQGISYHTGSAHEFRDILTSSAISAEVVQEKGEKRDLAKKEVHTAGEHVPDDGLGSLLVSDGLKVKASMGIATEQQEAKQIKEEVPLYITEDVSQLEDNNIQAIKSTTKSKTNVAVKKIREFGESTQTEQLPEFSQDFPESKTAVETKTRKTSLQPAMLHGNQSGMMGASLERHGSLDEQVLKGVTAESLSVSGNQFENVQNKSILIGQMLKGESAPEIAPQNSDLKSIKSTIVKKESEISIKQENKQGVNEKLDECIPFYESVSESNTENIVPVPIKRKPKNKAKSVDKNVGITEIGETTSDIADEKVLEKIASLNLQEKKSVDQAKSMEKILGQYQRPEELHDMEKTLQQETQIIPVKERSMPKTNVVKTSINQGVKQETDHCQEFDNPIEKLETTKPISEKSRATSRVKSMESMLGIQETQESTVELPKTDVQETSAAYSKEKKKPTEVVQLIEKTIGTDTQLEKTYSLEADESKPMHILSTREKSNRELAQKHHSEIGETANVMECNELDEAKRDKSAAANVETTQASKKSRVKSTERQVGISIPIEISSDLTTGLPDMESVDIKKEKNQAAPVVKLVEKVVGQTEEIKTTEDIQKDVIEDNKASLSKTKGQTQNVVSKTEKQIGVHQSIELSKDLEKTVTSQEETIVPKKVDKKPKKRIESKVLSAGSSVVTEVATEMPVSKTPDSSALETKEKKRARQAARSVERRIGLDEKVHEATDFDSSSPISVTASQAHEAPNKGRVSFKHSMQGIESSNVMECESLDSTIASKEETANHIMGQPSKKSRAKSTERQIGMTISVESTNDIATGLPKSESVTVGKEKSQTKTSAHSVENILGQTEKTHTTEDIQNQAMDDKHANITRVKKGAKEVASKRNQQIGEHHKYETCQNIDSSIPIDQSETIQPKDIDKKPQERIESRGILEGSSVLTESAADLPVGKEMETSAMETKEKSSLKLAARSVERTMGSGQTVLSTSELECKPPSTAMATETERTPMKDMASLRDNIQGIETKFEDTEDTKDILPAGERAVLKEESVKSKSRAKSMDRKEGVYNVEETTSNIASFDVATNAENVQQKLVKTSTIERAKSSDRRMGYYTPEEVTKELDVPEESKQFSKANETSERKGKIRASRTSLRKGFMPKRETSADITTLSEEEVRARVSKNKNEITEKAFLSPKLVGNEEILDETVDLEDKQMKGVTAASKRTPDDRSRTHSVEKRVGFHAKELTTTDLEDSSPVKKLASTATEQRKMDRVVSKVTKSGHLPKGEECEDMEIDEDLRQTATSDISKSSRHRSKSVDKRVGLYVEDLTANQFDEQPLILTEQAKPELVQVQTAKGMLTSRQQGFMPTEDKISLLEEIKPELQTAKESKTRPKRSKAQKRDKSVGYEDHKENVDDLKPEEKKEVSIAGKIVKNIFDKAKSLSVNMGILAPDSTVKESEDNKMPTEKANVKTAEVHLDTAIQNVTMIGTGEEEQKSSDMKVAKPEPESASSLTITDRRSETAQKNIVQIGNVQNEENVDDYGTKELPKIKAEETKVDGLGKTIATRTAVQIGTGEREQNTVNMEVAKPEPESTSPLTITDRSSEMAQKNIVQIGNIQSEEMVDDYGTKELPKFVAEETKVDGPEKTIASRTAIQIGTEEREQKTIDIKVAKTDTESASPSNITDRMSEKAQKNVVQIGNTQKEEIAKNYETTDLSKSLAEEIKNVGVEKTVVTLTPVQGGVSPVFLLFPLPYPYLLM